MKKTLALIATIMALLVFTACGTTTPDGDTVSVNCGAGGCGDVNVGDGNSYVTTPSDINTTPSVAFSLDNYDETYSESTCNDLGFFYCSTDSRCMPQPIATGSCSP